MGPIIINAETGVGESEVDPYSRDGLMQGMWERGDDMDQQEDDADDMHHEMVPDADVKRIAVENESNVEPYFSYRRILNNQRWKRWTDMQRHGFGKRSPDFNFAMATPYQYYNRVMANPYGRSFYEI